MKQVIMTLALMCSALVSAQETYDYYDVPFEESIDSVLNYVRHLGYTVDEKTQTVRNESEYFPEFNCNDTYISAFHTDGRSSMKIKITQRYTDKEPRLMYVVFVWDKKRYMPVSLRQKPKEKTINYCVIGHVLYHKIRWRNTFAVGHANPYSPSRGGGGGRRYHVTVNGRSFSGTVYR